jgi:hypothetical protein
MKVRLLLVLIISVTAFSCNKIVSYGKFTVYQKLDDNTTYILIIDGDPTRYSYKAKLNIDITTLKDLGGFLVDKNHVYSKYEISDVTLILPVEDADRATFRILENPSYAKDKNHVFHFRNGVIPPH